MSTSRVYHNPPAHSWRYSPSPSSSPTSNPSPASLFHSLLPFYTRTPLIPLPHLASTLSLGHILLKDESSRFSLPSFKILGASWAFYRAVCERLNLDLDFEAFGNKEKETLQEGALGKIAKEKGDEFKVITTTEGNWGRAVARMGKHCGVGVVVYVPGHMVEETRNSIRGEGAEVVVVDGDYDGAVAAVVKRAENDKRILMVMDISFEGYEDVQKWVVEGYQTMLDESDEQVRIITDGKPATHTIVPVGCGSIAQAVTQHYKSRAREENGTEAATVIATEPTTASCLKASLESGKSVQVKTQDSIMCGMNCGTLSTTAWPVLKAGVDASIVVGELEAHDAVEELRAAGVKAGPCGAATLAALRIICATERETLGLYENSVVVLNCTEGERDYSVPK